MKSLVAVSSVCLLMVLATSCDPMTDITFVNDTDQELEFYTEFHGQPALLGTRSVDARSSVKYNMISASYVKLRVAATREDGEWVFDRTYTRDEVERAKRRIHVSSLEPIAPPDDVRVIPSLDAPPPVLAPTKTSVAPGWTPTPGPELIGTPIPP